MINEWFPDDTGGELYKIEDWFEFPDNGFDFSSNNDADLTGRTILLNNQPTLVITPYRFMFRKRSVAAGDNTADYTNFLIWWMRSARHSNPNSTTGGRGGHECHRQLRSMDAHHRCSARDRNWDSYGIGAARTITPTSLCMAPSSK